jgi:hypothetical protein
MAEKKIRQVRKLTTFFSALCVSIFSVIAGDLNIRCFKANPKLIKTNNINRTTKLAINVFIGLLHEN